MNHKQYSFSEMSRKIVINVADGRELGHVCDMIFNNCGGVIGFIVPGKKSFFKSITSSDNIFIPWNRIIKIGSDVVLTELVGNHASACAAPADGQAVNAYAQQPQQQQYACPDSAYTQAAETPQSTAQTVYHTDSKQPEY